MCSIKKSTKKFSSFQIDVSSLYTNIPHDEGIQSIGRFVEKHKNDLPSYTPPSHVLQLITEFILKNSNFTFLNNHYLQKEGTSMGTRMAPPYANLFMARIEDIIQKAYPQNIIFWKRFIDEILFLFYGSPIELQNLLSFMNSVHPTIKFTFSTSKQSISFLDLEISKHNYQLLSTVHRKSTDTSMLLHYHSNYPQHIKECIIYSQALHYKLLISNDETLEQELYNLTKILLARDYPLNVINRNIKKSLKFRQQDLINKENTKEKSQNLNDTIPFNITYSTIGSKADRIFQKNWRQHMNNNIIRQSFPKPPLTGYKKDKSLKDILVKAQTTNPSPLI